MNRRGFIASLAAVAVLPLAPKPEPELENWDATKYFLREPEYAVYAEPLCERCGRPVSEHKSFDEKHYIETAAKSLADEIDRMAIEAILRMR